MRVGIEGTGYSRWFERLLAELSFGLWIGGPAEIKAERVKRQKFRTQTRGDRENLSGSKRRVPLTWWPEVRGCVQKSLQSSECNDAQLR